MRKITSYLVTFLMDNIFTIAALAQNVTISGNVRNSNTKENDTAVSVRIKGGSTGTFTDDKGNFTISTNSLPVTFVFSSIGYASQEVTVSTAGKSVAVEFVPSNTMGQEVVVSATRVPVRILESPVSIERIS